MELIHIVPLVVGKGMFIMLTLLILGPKYHGNDIDMYLVPSIDDRKILWEVGIEEAYDIYRKQASRVKVIVLWTINDFLIYWNLAGLTVKEYNACPICSQKICAYQLKHNKKIFFCLA